MNNPHLIFLDFFLLAHAMYTLENTNKYMDRHDYNHNKIPTFHTNSLPENLLPKLKPLISCLNAQQINIQALRSHLSFGIPDQAHLIRQYAWKVALGFLPKDKTKWHSMAEKQEIIYNEFVRQFLHPDKYKDYPIIFDKYNTIKCAAFQKDFYLWEQIQKDTCRTQSELSFFSTTATPIPIPFFTRTRREKYKLITGDDEISEKQMSLEEKRVTYRYDYMTRILFVFARLNPKVEYVQGMNEILAPIFYVVNSSHKTHVQEAACFYMFNNVMTDILELHMKDFGRKENGVHDRMRHISTMLLAFQPKTWQRLDTLKIDSFYYCFRWITLLFSQEFQMFETLRIWESIFSCEDRTAYANSFALALIVSSKQAIAKQEYGEILSYLKNICEHINLQKVISEANHYYSRYNMKEIINAAEKNRKKLEKQQQKGESRISKFFKKLF